MHWEFWLSKRVASPSETLKPDKGLWIYSTSPGRLLLDITHLFEGFLFVFAELLIFHFPLTEFCLQSLDALVQRKLVSVRWNTDTWRISNHNNLAPDSSWRPFSYSLSFSRTFWDSSRRSCSAFTLPESSSSVPIPSHSCLLRSCRLGPDRVRNAAGLTEPIMLRLSQSFSSPSGLLEQSPDSIVAKSCQRHRSIYIQSIQHSTPVHLVACRDHPRYLQGIV